MPDVLRIEKTLEMARAGGLFNLAEVAMVLFMARHERGTTFLAWDLHRSAFLCSSSRAWTLLFQMLERSTGPLIELADKEPDDKLDWRWKLTVHGWSSVEVFDGQIGGSWKMWKPTRDDYAVRTDDAGGES